MKTALALITIGILSLLLGSLVPFWRWTHRWISASTRTLRGPRGTGSPWAPSSRWPKRPMDIFGSAANSACFASMAFTLSLGNHPPGSNSPISHMLCS